MVRYQDKPKRVLQSYCADAQSNQRLRVVCMFLNEPMLQCLLYIDQSMFRAMTAHGFTLLVLSSVV